MIWTPPSLRSPRPRRPGIGPIGLIGQRSSTWVLWVLCPMAFRNAKSRRGQRRKNDFSRQSAE
jgi:hypothetical protein